MNKNYKNLSFYFNSAIINCDKADKMMQEAGKRIGIEQTQCEPLDKHGIVSFTQTNGSLAGQEDTFFKSLTDVAKEEGFVTVEVPTESRECRVFVVNTAPPAPNNV